MRSTRRPATVLLVAGIISALALGIAAALLMALDTRADTAQVVAERKVSGEPCIRVNGAPSRGCDRLAKLLAETCTLRPGLCKETVTRALRSKDAKTRREAALALGAGLAAAGIRGSLLDPRVVKVRSTALEKRAAVKQRSATKTTPVSPKARTGVPASTNKSRPGAITNRSPSSTVFTPDPLSPAPSEQPRPTVSVPTPDPPRASPDVTVPEIVPPEIPITPPITVPEVPVEPIPVPDPLPGATRNPLPVCGVPVVRPCRPGK